MDNMAKGCGRSDGPNRMPRILIPSLEKVVNNLTTTTYTSTSTVYNTFNLAVSSFTPFSYFLLLSKCNQVINSSPQPAHGRTFRQLQPLPQ